MPIHDWTRVDAGLFHAFHQHWIISLCNALNSGRLPPHYFALPEQNIRGPIPDVLTLKLGSDKESIGDDGGVAVAIRAPKTRMTQRIEGDSYLTKASRIQVRHRHGQVVAVIEIVSPGNKSSQVEFRNLVEKSSDLIRQGVHLLVIDLFPPGKRDPQGIHQAIWDQFKEADLELPTDKPLTLASYDAGLDYVAYVEFIEVNDVLPDMPLFLRPAVYVLAPLESSYEAAWAAFPHALKGLLDTPRRNLP